MLIAACAIVALSCQCFGQALSSSGPRGVPYPTGPVPQYMPMQPVPVAPQYGPMPPPAGAPQAYAVPQYAPMQPAPGAPQGYAAPQSNGWSFRRPPRSRQPVPPAAMGTNLPLDAPQGARPSIQPGGGYYMRPLPTYTPPPPPPPPVVIVASIEIHPIESVNPTLTQHTFVATVRDSQGNPVGGQRVEWTMEHGPDLVGAFVQAGPAPGGKLSSSFAVSTTSSAPVVYNQATPSRGDDFVLGIGQAWCTITSSMAGDSRIVAMAPAIADPTKHKAFAIKHWRDVKVIFPPDATNKAGTQHTLTVFVRESGGRPHVGYRVSWEITDNDPSAHFVSTRGTTATSLTDSAGQAVVVLEQDAPVSGDNVVAIHVSDSTGTAVASHLFRKIWRAPAIAITKSGPAEAYLNDRVTYSITVSNPSDTMAENVVLTDDLPSQFAYVESSPSGTASGGRVVWHLGTISGGTERTVALTVTAAAVGDWVNRARVETGEGLSAEAQAPTRIASAAISISKTGPSTAILGAQVPYSMTVQNTGSMSATNVVVRDLVPTGMSHPSGAALQWDVGMLAAGQSWTQQVSLRADQEGTHTNRATVTADRGLQDEAQATTVVSAPKLEITKTGPKERRVDQKATYAIVVSNPGSAPAESVVVTDTLPAGATFEGASDGGQLAGNTVRWDLGRIEPRGQRSLEIKLRLTQQGNICNRVNATAASGLSDNAEACTSVIGKDAMHIDSEDTEDPVDLGSRTTYIIRVRNEGTSRATQVQLENELPTQMEFVSASGPTNYVQDGRKVAFEPVAVWAAGEEKVYKITGKVVDVGNGNAVNSATLRSAEFKTPVISQEGTNVYPQ